MSEILIIDDDRFLADSVCRLLVGNGYGVLRAHSATDGYQMIAGKQPDLLILDLGLPDQDGISLCRRIRAKWSFPVLMLTSRSDTIDKVVGLEVGADDYLTKPFEANELLARVRAQLRRSSEYRDEHSAACDEDKLLVGPVEVDLSGHAVCVDGKPVDLTETEFKILSYLAANSGRALSREQVFETVWGYELEFSTNSLEVLIYRLRQKLEQAGCTPIIHTLRGYGYKLQPSEDSSAVKKP